MPTKRCDPTPLSGFETREGMLLHLESCGVPVAAMPPPGAGVGKLSYTIRSKNKAIIEVLLKKQAFNVKFKAGHAPWGCRGSPLFAWSKNNGVVGAWEAIKRETNWDSPAWDFDFR